MKIACKVSVVSRWFALSTVAALVVSAPIGAKAAPIVVVSDATYENVVRVTLPTSQVLEQDTALATNGLNITGSNPNAIPVFWTASTGNKYQFTDLHAGERAGSGVKAESESDLTYFVEFVGNAGTLPVLVQGHGEASAFEENGATNNTPQAQEDRATAFLEIMPANDSANPILNMAANTDLALNPGTHSFTINQNYTFDANRMYEVKMFASAHAAFQHDATADVDPFFVAPAGYTIVTSAGIGNALPATAPIPGALPLFTTALGGLGLLGWRRKKAAHSA